MLLLQQNEKFADDILTGGIWGLIKDNRYLITILKGIKGVKIVQKMENYLKGSKKSEKITKNS